MSMIGNLARIPETTRQRLHQDPSRIPQFLYPQAVEDESLPPDDVMDLDKAWHGLHFLFTGSDWSDDFPEGFLVACGKPVGDVDVGYGPARSFSPSEVEEIAAFLEAQKEGTLRQRLDPKAMAELEIYPGIWAEDTNLDEEWEYLLDGFRRMKEFVREAVSKKMALLVYLN